MLNFNSHRTQISHNSQFLFCVITGSFYMYGGLIEDDEIRSAMTKDSFKGENRLYKMYIWLSFE